MSRHDTRLNYRKQDGDYLIELSLRSARQMFNSMDPAPFHEKDLAKEAVEYIVESVEELHVSTPMRLRIYLPAEEAATPLANELPGAFRHYFNHRAGMTRRSLHSKLKQGRISLLIGLSFLILCLTLPAALQNILHGTLLDVIEEGLIIIGWVSMWRPVQIFLYDWWPIRHLLRVHTRIRDLNVEVLAQGETYR
jgi:hypothetical protein